MKKSKCYQMAQMAVLTNESILPSEKLEILRVLMDEENVQRICEKVEAEKAEKNESEVDPY
jgi:hypothetical protein